MSDQIILRLARELSLDVRQVERPVTLLDDGTAKGTRWRMSC